MTNRSKLCTLLISSILVLSLAPASSAASIAGAKCTKRNATKVVSGIHYYCNYRQSDYMMWQRDYNLSPEKSAASQSQSTQSIQTVILPNFVGHSQAEINTWKFQNGIQFTIRYATKFGYNYSVSCQMQNKGIVLSQRPSAGSAVANQFGDWVTLDINC